VYLLGTGGYMHGLTLVVICMQRVGERAVILSGMNAAEIGEIIGAYRDAGTSQLLGTHPHANVQSLYSPLDTHPPVMLKQIYCAGLALSGHARALCTVKPSNGTEHCQASLY